MAETAQKILFVNSEIFPFVPETPIAAIGRGLPQGIQERKKEIRSFMPRYGCINERKNQLHEVIRLSGMNIIIGDIDRPLVIKVASISAARIQVYFIDNEDYFRRKSLYADEAGNYFPDNGERAIFFARGVLETVKKLRWAPDIIHCQGWISHMLPLYLKKAYKDDPIFAASKVVLSLYGDAPELPLPEGFVEHIPYGNIGPEDLQLPGQATGMDIAKLAVRYSDGVILGSDDVPAPLADYVRSRKLPLLPYDGAALADGSYVDQYHRFYDLLASSDEA